MSFEEPSDDSLDSPGTVVVNLLEDGRPTPVPGFRGALGRHLSREDPGWGPRPAHLWPQALALITVGIALLLIGALISAGGI